MANVDTRQQILEFVHGHPASSARSIQRGLTLGWGDTAYHLRLLVENGSLVQTNGGRRDYYFTTDFPPTDRKAIIAMQSGVERALLVRLSRSDGMSFNELALSIQAGKSTVAFHLRVLLASELVRLDGTISHRIYHSTQPFQILRLYDAYKETFEDRLIDNFASTWGGLMKD